jgi:hypothetical protein
MKLSLSFYSTCLAKLLNQPSLLTVNTLTIRLFGNCAEQCQVELVVPVTTLEHSTLSTVLLMDAMLLFQVVAISI